MDYASTGRIFNEWRQTRTTYTITSTDVLNGFVPVPITWDVPFADTNYTVLFSIHDLDDTVDLSVGELDVHNVTATGCTPVVFVAAATPLVQAQVDLVASTATLTPLTLTAPITTLYQVTFYYGPADTTGSGTWTPTVAWEDPAGNMLTMTYPYLGPATAGDVNNYQSYSVPYFVMAGETIAVTGAYSDAAFPMNISIRVVQMPNNNITVKAGDQFIINAIAVHD